MVQLATVQLSSDSPSAAWVVAAAAHFTDVLAGWLAGWPGLTRPNDVLV